MLPRDYIWQGTEGGPPAPSRGGQQGGQTLLFSLVQFSPGHPCWAGRRGQDPTGAGRQGRREAGFPSAIHGPREECPVGEARGVWEWELGDSGLGEEGCLPGILAPSWLSLLCHPPSEREAVGRQA